MESSFGVFFGVSFFSFFLFVGGVWNSLLYFIISVLVEVLDHLHLWMLAILPCKSCVCVIVVLRLLFSFFISCYYKLESNTFFRILWLFGFCNGCEGFDCKV